MLPLLLLGVLLLLEPRVEGPVVIRLCATHTWPSRVGRMRAISAASMLRTPASGSSGTPAASTSAPFSSCADVKFPVDANLDLKPSLWPAADLNTSVVGRCSASVSGFFA